MCSAICFWSSYTIVHVNYCLFELQRKASDKQGQSKQKGGKAANGGATDLGSVPGNELNGSINDPDQQLRPKRLKRERPTKSVNENIEPAFTATLIAASQQSLLLPALDQSSGGFRQVSAENLPP